MFTRGGLPGLAAFSSLTALCRVTLLTLELGIMLRGESMGISILFVTIVTGWIQVDHRQCSPTIRKMLFFYNAKAEYIWLHIRPATLKMFLPWGKEEENHVTWFTVCLWNRCHRRDIITNERILCNQPELLSKHMKTETIILHISGMGHINALLFPSRALSCKKLQETIS